MTGDTAKRSVGISLLRSTSAKRIEALWLIVIITFGILGVRSVRSKLFEIEKTVKQKSDVYLLPPPDQVATMALGYDAAIADILWAHVLVSQGLHTIEQRRYENLTRLYDVINTLAPRWRTPYLFADALITFQASATPYGEVVKAREILERGVKNRPFDAEIWLNLGEFVSFVAPGSYLEEEHPKVAERWRIEGARLLARAAELGAENSDISWRALGGADILARQGDTEGSIRFLQRAYAVTDDEELKKSIALRLNRLMDKQALAQRTQRLIAFEQRVLSEFPFLRVDEALVLGPPLTPAKCAGPDAYDKVDCATTWRTWSTLFDANNR